MSVADGGTIDWHPQAGLLPTDEAALRDVQATILRAGGRPWGATVFIRFLDAEPASRWVRELVPELTSMAAQLADSASLLGAETGGYGSAARRPPTGRAPIVTFALSAAGYTALGVDETRRPAHNADPFERGMATAGLGDPPPAAWEEHLRGPHAVLRILADDAPSLVARVDSLLATVTPGMARLHTERTELLVNAEQQPIEHFGFLDGRSQPRFFSFDVNRDRERNIASYWSAAPPLDWVLCPDPLSADGRGSYLVARKLDQDAHAFREAEQQLATALRCSADEAGALLVGRNRLGRSVETIGTAAPDHDNGFLYEGRCPVAAHTRLMNPRDSRTSYPLARRGMTYGTRVEHGDGERGPKDSPTGGVGLLFMANTSDIAGQFEALQRRANGGDGRPFDPIIGQCEPVPGQEWVTPDGSGRAHAAIGGYVTMRGGEYFFMPSLSGLASI
ncbi:MAG: hypothetical protein IT196_00405 [Acidimicrobiales bacterium]|nr:hypothetical protein [Acidimicrobiales bacterium]